MRLSEFDISIFDNLADVEPLWRRAERYLTHYPFQTFDWISSWLSASPTEDSGAPLIVVVRAPDGAVQMILPLATRQRFGLRFVSWLAADVSDYHAPLIAPDFAQACTRKDFAALFQRILAALNGVDIYVLSWMPERMQTLPNPMALLPGARRKLGAYAAALPASFEAFLNKKRRKIHLDTLRQRKRLEQCGALAFERVEDEAEIARTVAIMLAQKSERFPEGSTERIDRRATTRQEFYRRIGQMKSDAFEGHVSRLTVGGEVIATHVGLRHRGRFYYIMPSFDAARWGKFSPGRILMECLIRDCIEAGLHAFDMTIGDEGYKKDWVDEELNLFQVMGGITWSGKAYCATHDATRVMRDRLRGTP